jgi:hypothetical protein
LHPDGFVSGGDVIRKIAAAFVGERESAVLLADANRRPKSGPFGYLSVAASGIPPSSPPFTGLR